MKKIVKNFIPAFILGRYHFLLACLSAFLYGFPSRKLTVIGVTGTKGKSTTVILAGKILEEAGHKVAWFTSATIKIGDKEQLNPYHMTMPGRFVIQRFLKMSVAAGCKFAVLEVTSEGIKQYRHKFINFAAAVFTNLKPEHIEAHGSFEKYRAEKLKLFKTTKNIHILNFDDENVKYFLEIPAREKWLFKIKNQNLKPKITNQNLKILKAENIKTKTNNISFEIQKTLFTLNLLGEFNVYNAIASICIGLSQGVGLKTSQKALEKIKFIPGRMEVIKEQPFKLIIDLAHTPDSYKEIFRFAKTIPHNKIISIFGAAGGGRDKWKRPVLGKIAAQNSDIIILTNEDPYNEDPLKILEEIESGFSQISNDKFQILKYEKILDRREAIKKGLILAKENDIILILGKGTEQLMIIGGKKISWDDRLVVRDLLKELNI